MTVQNLPTILDPPFWIFKNWIQYCNQRPQKLLTAEFQKDGMTFSKICPPYWIRHFEFWKSEFRSWSATWKTEEYRISCDSNNTFIFWPAFWIFRPVCACVAQLIRAVDGQSKDPGSNPGTVESVFSFTERFQIL